jgi:hypothetical protein
MVFMWSFAVGISCNLGKSSFEVVGSGYVWQTDYSVMVVSVFQWWKQNSCGIIGFNKIKFRNFRGNRAHPEPVEGFLTN